MKKLAAIAAMIVSNKAAWGANFLAIAEWINATSDMSTDTKEIGESWDMFLSHIKE